MALSLLSLFSFRLVEAQGMKGYNNILYYNILIMTRLIITAGMKWLD